MTAQATAQAKKQVKAGITEAISAPAQKAKPRRKR